MLWSDRTGYNAPVMAFDSRRICLMDCFAGRIRLIYDANIVKLSRTTKFRVYATVKLF